MIFTVENVLLIGSVLLFTSIVASKTSSRFGVPALILFLIVGMLAGSDGPGGIYFDDPEIAQFMGIVALTLILFSGGLDTKLDSIRPILKDGISLSTLGILITTVSVGLFSSYVLGFTIEEGMLIGAVMSSTDAAAVFSILRSKNVGLKGNIRPLLEFESGSNDPMAYFLTISMIYLIQDPDSSVISLVPRFVKAMVIGGMAGYGFGKLMTLVVNKIHLDVEGLYPVLMLSMVFFNFSLTDAIGGNAFLSVYLSAIILGNESFIHKKSLMRFFDGMAWIMQIIMFLTLGLLVFPLQMVKIIPEGILLSVFLILIARPLSVFISMAFAKDMNFRKKLFISWVGLRGATPIIFATYPMIAGVSYADTVFNLVFFITVTSIVLQGTTLPIMAKWLHVKVPEKITRKFPLDIELKGSSKTELIELDVQSDSPAIGKEIVGLKLPITAQIVLIHRNGRYVAPTGDTIIEPRDHVLILADNKLVAEEVQKKFSGEHS